MAKPVLEWVVARDDRGTAAAAGVGRRAVATVAELGVGVVRERTPPVIEEVGGGSSIDRGGGVAAWQECCLDHKWAAGGVRGGDVLGGGGIAERRRRERQHVGSIPQGRRARSRSHDRGS
jgi:hypothetical protein